MSTRPAPISRSELRRALVARRPEDHKGTFGHVLVVAGSAGMAGAAVLATRAALRSGAGLVTLALPSSLQSMASAAAPEALTLGLPETAGGSLRSEGIARLQQKSAERDYTVLAIGPGLSHHPETAKFVLHALSGLDLPAVIDADALNVLAAQDLQDVRQLMRSRRSGNILTPHPGEMARCLRRSSDEILQDRERSAETLAQEWSGVCLLKGHRTLISDGKRTAVNATGGPGLAKGGTGDVLTGLIAGLWAQLIGAGRLGRESAFAATALGAHLHGRAGDAAARALTPWAMTACDVLDRIPDAFRALAGR